MSITILEVLTSKQHREFLNLPWMIYQHDSKWVPPLKISVKAQLDKKHPFYDHATLKQWLAYKNNRPIGRIAAIVNEAHNLFHSEEVGFFGFFECIENFKAATMLFETAESYLRQQGLKKILGPVNPSTNYECGMLIEGFDDPPQLMMTYNPEYYPFLLEKLNYLKAKDLLAYKLNPQLSFPAIFQRASERIEKSNRVTWRALNKKNWNKEVELIHSIYNDAWEKNWGFVPLTEQEFFHMAKDMKAILDPAFVQFAMVHGEEVGFIIGLLDYNQVFKQIPSGRLLPFGILKLLRAKKYINRLRVVTLGVRRDFQQMGLAPLLMRKLQAQIQKRPKLKEAEQSWILEDNEAMNKPLRVIRAEVYKRYRIYQKEL